MDNKPKLEEAFFTFSQEAHCNSEEEHEEIKIAYMSSLGIDRDKGGYFVLKTDSWAVEDEKDLKELFERIKKVLNENN
jgi:hypothetical protein